MRLTLVLMAASLMQVYATGYTQSAKISLALKNVSLKQALKEIEKQSDYTFVYSDSKIDVNKKIDINVKDCALVEVLDQLIADSEIRYTSIDNHIVLTDKKNYIYRLPSITHEAVLNREVIDMESLSPIRNVLLQQVSVSGQVVSSVDGQPLPGVNVVVKGTTLGTTTDINGSFNLNVPDPNATLVFSFVGFQTQEVALAGQKSVNITLVEETQELQEIVVVGYGVQSKATLTGSVATVNNEALSAGTQANALQRMQGKASGVTVLNSHTPGGDATIRIRGMGTINNNDPLYVIDGVPTKWGMSQLNANEIESITVLKDASSAAIYGARGANGVIIVTTKRGKSGKPQVSFSARAGFGKAAGKYDLLNTQEYGELLWLEAKNEGRAPNQTDLYGTGATPTIPDYINPAGAMEGDPRVDPSLYSHTPGAGFNNITRANKEGTDWYDAIYRTAKTQEYSLSLVGGGEKGTYSLSAGYLSEEGILKYVGFERMNIRSNADAEVTKWLKIGESLGIGYSQGKGNNGDNGEGVPISQAYRMQPIVPVYDIMGNFAGTKGNGTGNGENPLAMLYRDQNDYRRDLRGIGNAYAEVTILKDFKFKSLFGFDYRTFNSRDIFLQNPEFQEAKPADILTMDNNYTIQWNWVNTLNYIKTIAEVHKINVLVGTEAIGRNYNHFNASRSTFFSTDVDYMYLGAGEKDFINNGDGTEVKSASYFARVNYDFKGKYLIEGTFRRDGSSKFGSEKRWGNFPAFSLGWRISEENFMAATKTWMDYLKLRGGWGVSGNDELGSDYNGFTTYASNNQFAFYSMTGNPTATTAGFVHDRLGNPDAQWETTKTTNVGFDAGFLNNTLTVGIDLWQRKTTNMLYRLTQPGVYGSYQLPSVNIGDMDNKGYDIQVGYRNKALGGDFTYDINWNISHYKNEIKKISDNEAEFIGGANLRQVEYTRSTVGTSFPEFYGLIVDGIFQSDAEAKAYPVEFDAAYNVAGHFKFRDIAGGPDGGPDGKIDDADRTYIGSPHPKFTTGLNIDLAYKNLTLNAFFYASYGNKIMNYVKRWIDYSQFNGNRSKDRLYKSWGSPYLTDNADAELPRADLSEISQKSSTAFLEDGSFLRLKTLQLGYTLPNNFINKIGMARMEVYVQANNLFTITEYSGLDPEINASGSNLGIDQGSWPTTRQFMFGVKIDL